jgi:hypothetical protein
VSIRNGVIENVMFEERENFDFIFKVVEVVGFE